MGRIGALLYRLLDLRQLCVYHYRPLIQAVQLFPHSQHPHCGARYFHHAAHLSAERIRILRGVQGLLPLARAPLPFLHLVLVGLVISRGMVNAALHNYRKRGFSQRNVLLLGKGTLTDQLRNLIVSNPEYGYKLHEADYSTGADAMETIESYLHEHHIDEIYCALGEFEPELVYELMELTDRHLVNLNLFPDYRRVSLDKVRFTYIDHFPLISVSNEPLANRLNKWSKRLFDIAISALVLLLASPIFALVALITKLSSPGPVVFSQERVGQSRRPFRIYKFRSMKVNAEQQGPGLSSDNDPRITPWGRFMRKTRLDELPQFYNVLVGDMSIVGPRPERQFFIDQIVAKSPHYKKLHRLKPGITSLGQVKFGYAENVPQMLQRLRYDILYVENWSLLLDLRIIFMTIGVVVQGRGK
ncbi:MAG: sugar transferase [Cytophagales bacterium]|nr:sugar transferase [Cytophagales bacterium]